MYYGVCNMHTEVCAGLYSCTNFLTFEYAYYSYYILLNNKMACLLASIFFATLFHVRLKIIGHVSTS